MSTSKQRFFIPSADRVIDLGNQPLIQSGFAVQHWPVHEPGCWCPRPGKIGYIRKIPDKVGTQLNHCGVARALNTYPYAAQKISREELGRKDLRRLRALTRLCQGQKIGSFRRTPANCSPGVCYTVKIVAIFIRNSHCHNLNPFVCLLES